MIALDLRETPEGVTLPLYVVPRGGRSAVERAENGVLRVRVGAAPVAGAANRALLDFLSESLARPRRDITLVRGEHSRQKVVLVRGISLDELRARLAALL